MKIVKRNCKTQRFNEQIDLTIGDCITGRVDENYNIINYRENHYVNNPNSVYIVYNISPKYVFVVDADYNEYILEKNHLEQYEVFNEIIHINLQRISQNFINQTIIDYHIQDLIHAIKSAHNFGWFDYFNLRNVIKLDLSFCNRPLKKKLILVLNEFQFSLANKEISNEKCQNIIALMNGYDSYHSFYKEFNDYVNLNINYPRKSFSVLFGRY